MYKTEINGIEFQLVSKNYKFRYEKYASVGEIDQEIDINFNTLQQNIQNIKECERIKSMSMVFKRLRNGREFLVIEFIIYVNGN